MTILATDPVALTQALVRCPSVTPEDAGALAVLESVLKPAGFHCERKVFTEPGTADIDNLYARLGTIWPEPLFRRAHRRGSARRSQGLDRFALRR